MRKDVADLFRRITHGVYVIGVVDGDKRNAFTAAWVMQVSFQPLMIALSINPHHYSYALLRSGQGFTVNVLGKHQAELARSFARPATSDKLGSTPWRSGVSGAPILEEALAYFECEWVRECLAGDHVIIVGRVFAGNLQKPYAEPMTYRDTGQMDGAIDLYPDDLR